MAVQFLRRRIRWRLNTCSAFCTDNDSYWMFSWSHEHYEFNDALKEMVPIKEPGWQLYIDGAADEKFPSEAEVKGYIIRFIYGVRDFVLIPSELLYEAGLVYVTNEWVDEWGQIRMIPVEARKVLPTKPKDRQIRLPDFGTPDHLKCDKTKPALIDDFEPARTQIFREKISDDHRTSLRIVPRHGRQRGWKNQGPSRLQKGDDLELNYREELEVWWADQCGAGLDEFDFLSDDECFIVLETGACDGETCATVTIDPETPAGEVGTAEVQDAGEAAGAAESDVFEDDFYRFG